jgi:hypothetical protein
VLAERVVVGKAFFRGLHGRSSAAYRDHRPGSRPPRLYVFLLFHTRRPTCIP